MPDREMVIKSLMELHGSEETMAIISDAVALLKEQEAIEPKEKDYVWRCGKCDEYLTSIENHRIRFCLYCGKAVKWE